MVALGATLVAAGPSGSRDIPAEGFFKDLFTTDLQPAEILTAVRVPTYGKGTGGAYLKHRHPASSYAVVGVAALVEMKDGKCARASVVVGGATVNPVRGEGRGGGPRGRKPVDDAHARRRRGQGRGGDQGPARRPLRVGRVPRPPRHRARPARARPGRVAGQILKEAASR